jgi:hypothetical protein
MACVWHVRFEGSRITVLRVQHRATNESQLHRAPCDLSWMPVFSQRHRTSMIDGIALSLAMW